MAERKRGGRKARKNRTSEPLLLTADEVASLLQVSRASVYEWARRGELPSVLLSAGKRNCVRFELQEIKDWIPTRRKKGKAAKKWDLR